VLCNPKFWWHPSSSWPAQTQPLRKDSALGLKIPYNHQIPTQCWGDKEHIGSRSSRVKWGADPSARPTRWNRAVCMKHVLVTTPQGSRRVVRREVATSPKTQTRHQSSDLLTIYGKLNTLVYCSFCRCPCWAQPAKLWTPAWTVRAPLSATRLSSGADGATLTGEESPVKPVSKYESPEVLPNLES
jgi:hypothetical protein